MNSDPLSESMPLTGNGKRAERPTNAAKTHSWALFRIAAVSVHPVWMSVTVRV